MMKFTYSVQRNETFIHWTISLAEASLKVINPLIIDRPKFKANYGLIIDAQLPSYLISFLALHYRNMNWVAIPCNNNPLTFLVVKGNKQSITAGDTCWIATNTEGEDYLVWHCDQD